MDNLLTSDSKMMTNSNSPVTKKFYDSPEKTPQIQPLLLSIPFDWDEYLKRSPALVAPKEAFMQARHQLKNKFHIGMKLEARDPKKNDASAWSLATIVALEGSQRIRLRFDGSDSMSDIFELINSNNIKPLHSNPILYPPMAYRGNIANYSKFVQKVLDGTGVVKAPPECFEETPDRPPKNLFKVGMKLEALDRKNVHLIYPATVGEVSGDEIRIIFDGWRGSFDYSCKYYSREIFPINWCRDNNHPIAPPKAWEKLIQGKIDSLLNMDSSVSSHNNSHKKVSPNQIKNDARFSVASTKTDESSITQSSQSKLFNDTKLKVKHTPKRKQTPAKHLYSNTSQSQPTPIKFQPTQVNKPLSQQSSMKPATSKESELLNNKSGVQLSRSKIIPQSDNDSDTSINMTNDFHLRKVEDNLVDLSKLSPLSRTIPYLVWREMKGKSQTMSENEIKTSTNAKESSFIEPNESFFSDDNSTTLVSAISGSGSSNTSVIENSNTFCSQSSSMNKKFKSDDFGVNNNSTFDGNSNNTSTEAGSFPSTPYQTWTVKDVLNLINSDTGLAKYSNVFIDNEIDGNAFVLLTTDFMKNHMGLKLGPVLKINQLIERAKQQ